MSFFKGRLPLEVYPGSISHRDIYMQIVGTHKGTLPCTLNTNRCTIHVSQLFHISATNEHEIWTWKCVVFHYRVRTRNQTCTCAVKQWALPLSHPESVICSWDKYCFLVPLDCPASHSVFQHTGSALLQKASAELRLKETSGTLTVYICVFLDSC